MKKLLVFLILLQLPVGGLVFAQKRSQEQARLVAASCVNRLVHDDRMLVSSSLADVTDVSAKVRELTAGGVAEKPFYIFADTAAKSSFVIVSGDERMKPVLGYGDHGEWNGSCMPDALLELLDTYRQQYLMLQTTTDVDVVAQDMPDTPTVQPMIETTWSQGVPFNLQCPKGCPSGCVATAMAQVMRYHRFPATGQYSFDYTSASRNFKCSYDFSTAVFEWDSMKNDYAGSTGTTTADNAVAEIMYACGVSVGMDYNSDGSGAYMSDVPYALIHFFGYNDNVSYCQRNNYSSAEWYSLLCEELVAGRPVLYAGSDSRSGGHAFVIDGCKSDDGKFHVNWGWGGDYDGYFELDALNPDKYRYASYQSMIVNVSPQLVGTHRDVFYAERFSVSGALTFGKSSIFTMTDVYCYSSQSSYVVTDAQFNGTIGVGLFDAEFNYLESLASEAIEGLNSFYGYSKLTYSVNIQKGMFPKDGTYYIAPYIQAVSSDAPTRIRTTGGKTDYIVVSVDGDNISSEGNVEPIEMLSEWTEDFEAGGIPRGWSQNAEIGTGQWKTYYVLKESESIPQAAHGNGYAYLDYAKGTELTNDRSVTRLITDNIPLLSESQYDLSFKYRKRSTRPDPTDILTVYYKDADGWVVLTDVAVTNQDEWSGTTIHLPKSNNLRLAFEGSPSKGSSIFLDDLRIGKRDDTTGIIERMGSAVNEKTTCRIYSLMGVPVGECAAKELGALPLKRGVYLLRQNGKTKKIRINK